MMAASTQPPEKPASIPGRGLRSHEVNPSRAVFYSQASDRLWAWLQKGVTRAQLVVTGA